MFSGGDSVRMCGLRPAAPRRREMRQTRLRTRERAARVYALHQIVTPHWRGRRASKHDCAGIVHQNINAAEHAHRFVHRGGNRGFVTHIQLQRQRFAAGGVHFGRHAMYRAGQRRMRLGGLRGDDNIRAIAGATQRNFAADTAARARDEQRFTF